MELFFSSNASIASVTPITKEPDFVRVTLTQAEKRFLEVDPSSEKINIRLRVRQMHDRELLHWRHKVLSYAIDKRQPQVIHVGTGKDA